MLLMISQVIVPASVLSARGELSADIDLGFYTVRDVVACCQNRAIICIGDEPNAFRGWW